MDKKKKNLLIGGLLAVVLLLAVGYAAFATTLTINGTSTIDSRWDVHIKNGGVSVKSYNMATNVNAQKDSQLTASFQCELTDPGVSTISYDIIVENSGTFGAKLSSINLTGTTAYIDATTEGIEVGDVIDPNGGTDTLTVTVSYKNVNTVPTGEDATANITVTLNFVQAGGASSGGGNEQASNVINGRTIDQTFVPQYYRFGTQSVSIGSDATTGAWTTDPTTLTGHNYYLGHDVDSTTGKVIENYACFILNDTQYCLHGRTQTADINYYNQNKTLLETLRDAGEITCSTTDTSINCSDGSLNFLYATRDGYVGAGISSSVCCYSSFVSGIPSYCINN